MRRLWVVILLCTAVLSAPNAATESALDRDWTAFRQRYKFHIQTIALSEPDASGGRTLIVAEPPPHVTLEALGTIHPAFAAAAIKKHLVGYDGWVKDIVARIDEPDQELQRIVSELTQAVFFTSYKAAAVSIPRQRDAGTPRSALDLTVPAARLRGWVLSPTSKFVPLLGGAVRTVHQLAERKQTGVFFSVPSGLVVWLVPTAGDLSAHRIEARQFALDSDLVLGAVGAGEMVAIVGRERVVPCDVLPPLRTETILLLASVGSDELAQSYERNNFTAGKFDKTTHADWAPIFLSDELVDTEYGSLLNVTDQLLKGWSLNGTVKYANFEYTPPAKWPFEKPIIELLDTPVLTFNWNTVGAGYAVQDGPVLVSALHRTGALPVSYIPENAGSGAMRRTVADKEERAYSYFAAQNDPNLVRVVQYAALYQIFRRFDVRSAPPHAVVRLPEKPLAGEIAQMLDAFVTVTDEQIRTNFAKLKAEAALTTMESIGVADSAKQLDEIRGLLADVKKRWGNAGIVDLAGRLASPRGPHDEAVLNRLNAIIDSLPAAQQERALKELSSGAAIVASIDRPGTLLSRLNDTDRRAIALQYIASDLTKHRSLIRVLTGRSVVSLKRMFESVMARPETGWIRTPSMVVSFTGDALHTGGHNLDAAVSELRASATVPRGTVRISDAGGRRTLLYNPLDSRFPHELAPFIARFKYADPAALEGALNKMIAGLPGTVPPVQRAVALGFTDTIKPSVARGLQQQHVSSPLPLGGFRTARQTLTPDQARFLESIVQPDLITTVVERQSPTSIMIYRGGSGQVIEATDMTGMVDALSQVVASNHGATRPSVLLFRKGFSTDEALATVESVRIKAPGEALIELERSTAADIVRLMKPGEFSPRLARVVSVDEVPLAGGRRAIDVVTEIPHRTRVASLLLKIRIFFNSTVRSVQEVANTARTVLEQFFVRIGDAADTWSSYRIAAEANRTLKARFGPDAVRVIIEQAKDYVVGEIVRPRPDVG